MNKIGKMKDESEGKINIEISNIEFVGLKSKVYSLKNVDSKRNKIGKRVNSVVVQNIKYKEYLDFLRNKK